MPRHTTSPQQSTKPIRVRADIYEEICRIARVERRTLLGQMEKIFADWSETAKANGAYPSEQSKAL